MQRKRIYRDPSGGTGRKFPHPGPGPPHSLSQCGQTAPVAAAQASHILSPQRRQRVPQPEQVSWGPQTHETLQPLHTSRPQRQAGQHPSCPQRSSSQSEHSTAPVHPQMRVSHAPRGSHAGQSSASHAEQRTPSASWPQLPHASSDGEATTAIAFGNRSRSSTRSGPAHRTVPRNHRHGRPRDASQATTPRPAPPTRDSTRPRVLFFPSSARSLHVPSSAKNSLGSVRTKTSVHNSGGRRSRPLGPAACWRTSGAGGRALARTRSARSVLVLLLLLLRRNARAPAGAGTERRPPRLIPGGKRRTVPLGANGRPIHDRGQGRHPTR